MDWTAFDHDDQAMLVLTLVTGHGRAAPLLWLSAWKDELKKQRNDFEDACLRRRADLVPSGCRVTILANRGFGDQKLVAFLDTLGFGYVSASAATSMSPPPMDSFPPRRETVWTALPGMVGMTDASAPHVSQPGRLNQPPKSCRAQFQPTATTEPAVSTATE